MAFGLDIGSHSIKAVQLAKAGENYSIVAAGITSSPLPGMKSESEQDLQAVAEAVKKLVQDTKIEGSKANISLPESRVFTRLISLPELSDEEVASAISWQAEPYIPIPVAEASIDYQIVGRRKPQGSQPGGVDVLLVAAPKALIEKYIRVLNYAGLTVASVETELTALARSIAPQEGTALILDLGATSTDLAVVRAKQILLSRSIPTAGDALTRALSTGLSVDTEQAEQYKKTYGFDETKLEGKVKGALDPAFRLIIDEMKKAMQYYKTELKAQEEVVLILISGGVAGTPQVIPYLAESLGLEVILGDPFAKLSGRERLDKSFTAYSPLYGVAVGLALNV